MMHDVVRGDARRFIVIVSAGVQVSIETRKVTAGNLDANAMAGFKEVARVHRRKAELVNLVGLHPGERLVVTVAITQTLNCLIQIVGATIRIDIDQLHGEVCVLRAGRHKKSYFNTAAQFQSFFQRLGAVDENVSALFHFALIPCATLHRVACAADVATVRRHRVHRIVIEFVGRIGSWR